MYVSRYLLDSTIFVTNKENKCSVERCIGGSLLHASAGVANAAVTMTVRDFPGIPLYFSETGIN